MIQNLKTKTTEKTLYALPNDSKNIPYQECIIVALEQYNLRVFCTIAYLQPVIFNSMAFKVEIVKLDSFENRYSACWKVTQTSKNDSSQITEGSSFKINN